MIPFIHCGRVLKTQGVKGELELDLLPGLKKTILEQGVIFIQHDGQKVPYYISNYRDDGRLFVSFEDVKSLETAKSLSFCDVFTDRDRISEKILKQIEKSSRAKNELEGYLMIDNNQGCEAKIMQIQEFSGQLMAVVHVEGKGEMRIPMHEDLIEEIRTKEKKVFVYLPKGIWEL